MPVKVIVGTQFGDEGKGKAVDFLSKDADLTVRFQGGDNAGHTVINSYGVFKLHLVPCGIFRENCVCLIASGTVVNPSVLTEEMQMLKNAGVSTRNLRIDRRAQLVMPYHVLFDEFMERAQGIGTTKRGIGWAYASKYLRKNLRIGDLLKPECWQQKIEEFLPLVNAQLRFFGGTEMSEKPLILQLRKWSNALSPYICDGFTLIHDGINADKRLVFEGQLGVMKDIDVGIYPFVTSSHPIAAYASVSGGFPVSKIDCVCGVVKAFLSAVGDGPFPTEITEEVEILRGSGENPDDEFGARTGRARRVGWLDLPMLQFAHSVNGFSELILTKLDKLDRLKTIRICTGYILNGKEVSGMPDTDELYRVHPVYQDFPGWQSDTAECKSYIDLPENAKRYVGFIEKQVDAPIKYIGNGPARENMLQR